MGAALGLPAQGGEAEKSPAAHAAVSGAGALAKTADPTLAPDPAVRQGVLPNGLRYQLMSNAVPKGAVSIRLGVEVGSFEEADAERGAAHFIEHMAFRATRRYPDGAPDRVFAPWGVVFGRDQNAVTELFSTSYMLDMPHPDDRQLETGLAWLRDVADGVVFTEEGVARERGVVLAEMETRGGPQVDARNAISRFQAPEVRSVERLPIGVRETLNAATPASLKRFYDAWYRPEHAVLTVVGDRPLDALEAMVKTAFADWTGRGPKPVRAKMSPPRAKRSPEGFVVAGESLPTAISACAMRPGVPPQADTVAFQRREALSLIWQAILNDRLARRSAAADTHLLGALAMSPRSRELGTTCLVAMPVNSAWREALAESRAELNRFAQEGPTEIEVENAIEKQRSLVRGAYLGAASRTSPDLAAGLMAKALAGQVVRTPAASFYVFDHAVEDASVEEVRAAFAEDWAGSGPLLSMTAVEPPTGEALLAAWNDAATTLSNSAADTRVTNAVWGYRDFGRAGKVVERKTIDDPGFVRLRFANGLILNFKQTKAQPNKVEARVNFGAGRREIADQDNAIAQFAAPMLVSGGLRKNSFEDIQALFPVSGLWNFQFDFGAQSFFMRSSVFSDDLTTHLQILTAYVSDPGFRGTLDARMPTAVDMVYRTLLSQPPSALSQAMSLRLDPTGANSMPPQATMAAYRAVDFDRVLRPALTTAPLELTIAGDLDETQAVQAVASTFGALPPRAATPRDRSDVHFVRYPAEPVEPVRVEHQGPADKAAATLIWPLYVATPERRSEEYAIKLLAAAFDTALRRRIREELGKTYAPVVSSFTPDHGDQGALVVGIEAEPRDIALLAEEAERLAARFRNGEITEQMLDDARQPVLASAQARRETAGWWAEAMAGSARDPAILAEALQFEPLVKAVTVDDLKAAARTWLARPPIKGFAYPATKTAQTSTGAIR